MRKVIERHERRKSEGDEGWKDTSLILAFGETHSSQRLTSIPSGQIPEHLAASNTLREDGEGEKRGSSESKRGRPRACNLSSDRWHYPVAKGLAPRLSSPITGKTKAGPELPFTLSNYQPPETSPWPLQANPTLSSLPCAVAKHQSLLQMQLLHLLWKLQVVCRFLCLLVMYASI